jgi:hypothetical protein
MGMVGKDISTTTRASYLVENLKGRINPFCNFWKQMGEIFSEWLNCLMSDNPLACSRKKERENGVLDEMLNKKEHVH